MEASLLGFPAPFRKVKLITGDNMLKTKIEETLTNGSDKILKKNIVWSN